MILCRVGALGVAKADLLTSVINKILPHFSLRVVTLDWHPKNHVSFAASYSGKKRRCREEWKDF